jgi:eukaryotic-like serine/threonine-protein kinase
VIEDDTVRRVSVGDPFGLVGQVLDGQFRVDKLVGEGGFSAVYRGHHQGLNEPIAIKSLKLPPSLGAALVDTFVQRFRDESRILYRLSQGNLHIVRSIAAGTTQAPATGALVPYMVLEWLEGRSVQNDFIVRRTIGQTGRSLGDIIKLFDTAADGLAYAHAQGVVHRDLNPGNLFLASTQQGVKMKVLDFGVAKLMHDGALNMGPRQQTVGQIKIFAPAYGAPEQFDDRIGTVGAFSDVYAFALILIEALRDRCVNEGTHIGEFAQSACDPAKRPTPRAFGVDVPDEVEAAFARATTLDPKERWQSAGDFWQSLTIANKVASEHRHETAARETPPLALGVTMAGPVPGPSAPPAAQPPKDADAGATAKNLARTIPLGSSTISLPRPAPAAPRPRTPTTIGIPLPATGGRPPSNTPGATKEPTPAAVIGAGRGLVSPTPGTALMAPAAPPRASARPPSSPRNPALPAVQPLTTKGGTDRPPAAGAPAAAAPPPSPPVAPPSNEVIELSSMEPMNEEEQEDEATKVHAPAPEVLRTLAFHDASQARAQAQAMIARERAAREAAAAKVPPVDEASMLEAAARSAAVKPPYVDIHADIPEPPPSGGTLMMAPIALAPRQTPQDSSPRHRAPGGLGSTLAMASPLQMDPRPGFATGASAHHASEPHDWQAPTQAMPAVPVQAAPGMQGIPGAYGTLSQGVPLVNLNDSCMVLSYGQGSAIVAPSMQGGAYQAPPQQHSQQPAPHQQSYARGPGEHAFPPPSFAQAPAAPPNKSLPIVPIAIGLAMLALGGLGLGFFALRARHASQVDPAGSATSSEVAPDPSLTAVPVAPDDSVPAVAPPVPTATAEVDAAAATPEPEDAAAAVAPPTTPPTTAVVTPPPTPAPPPVAPAGQPQPPAPMPIAAPPPSAKPPVDPNAFSESAARARLGQANGVLAFCKKEGGVTGPGNASVTFANDGSVAGVAVDPPYAGTSEGNCVASQFRRAKVTPFTGPPQTVRHGFEVPK